MAKKSCSRCCSTFFPCFPCFSERNSPSSSALANASSANVANDNTNTAFPAVATPASIPPHASTSRHAAASSSAAEASSSTAVPKIVKPDDNEAPSCSTSSSSTVQTISDAINNIRKDTDNVDLDGIDLDGLISHISDLLKLLNEEGKKSSLPKKAQQYLPTSKSWFKLKEFLSEATNFLKDIIPGDAKKIARGLLQNMGTAHLTTTGLLVVANILERFENVSKNKDECLHLMKRMGFLAKVVKQYEERSQLKEGMHNVIEEAIEWIVESSIICCSQMDSSTYSKLFSGSVNKEKLDELKQKLDDINMKISLQMGICIHDASERKKAPLSKLYYEDAVGLEESLYEVIDMLEWGSKRKAVTVILHGFGGMGKTTLADRVFSQCKVEGCKYSEVQLFRDIKSTPNIVELQKMILKDLMDSENIPEIRKHQDGQRELGNMLKKVQAFIYIDNVLSENELRELLPVDMNQAMKVRLLLTARNENVGRVCPMETPPKIYHMRGISPREATKLLQKHIKEEIDSSQFNEIVNICGGIPLMLTLAGPFIGKASDKQKAYRRLMQEKGRLKIEPFDSIERYVFAYDDLPDICKDPFLDICLYFKGWDWDLVADIVGEYPLDMLESRGLVTKGTNGVTSLHDVILTLGCQQEKELRFKFTSASEMKKRLDRMEEKDIEKIKGIWLRDNKDLFLISSTKLDSMHRSLRILNLGNFTKVEGRCNKIFQKLIFFQGTVPYLPFDVTESDMKYLSYQPRDLKLCEMPPDLRYMEFNGKLHSRAFEISSRDFQQLKNLRILRLTGFAKLNKLPEQLGDLVTALQELSLSYCKSIKELPPSISKLQRLSLLRMNGCSSLMHLPEDIGYLNSLQELNLQSCTNLELLPPSIEKLSSLKLLDLSNCKKLLQLPYDIGNLTSLVNLSLKNCDALYYIPESIGQLKSLAFSMDMSGCASLNKLPNLFVQLGNLSELNLCGCRRLSSLPEGFGQLKCLVKLNLSECRLLVELCHDFHYLSSLRILYLSNCRSLKKLPPDFHCLASLENLYIIECWSLCDLTEGFHDLPSLQQLYLCHCDNLGGEWMDKLVKLKALQIMNIQGSDMLVKRWKVIQGEGNQSWSVYTGQDLSKKEKGNLMQKLLSELDCLLIDKREKPFHISNLPLDTLSLVMFHSNPDEDFPWPLIEEALEDIQIDQNFQMIYIGKHFNKLPSKVNDRILGHSHESSQIGSTVVKLLLALDEAVRESWLSTLDEDVRVSWLERYNAEEPIYFLMEMVKGSKDDKCSPCWKVLSNREVEEFVLSKCERYLKLKKLVEIPQESNLELLTELFATREEENIFQRNYASASNRDTTDNHCGLSKVKGKTILLEMRNAELCDDPLLSALIEMYCTDREKENLDLEIISIPIVQTQFDVLDAVEQFAKEVPWLVLQDPLRIRRVVKYFLTTQWKWHDRYHGSIMWIIEPKGKISICQHWLLFLMMNKWRPKAYEKFEEIRKKEWNQLASMSSLNFLFNHSVAVMDKVKEVMFQEKMICLYSGNKEVACSIRNAMIELRESIHIIYIPRYYKHTDMKTLRLTDTIYKSWYLLEKDEMQQAIDMEGMSVLNLSEHEAARFWMSLLYLKEEINGMDDYIGKQLCEMKRLLQYFQLMNEDEGDECCMILMEEDGKMVAGCRGETMKWIFRDNREDRTKQLMKRLIKVSKEEGRQRDDDSASVLDSTEKMQTTDQENVEVDLDSLSKYTSELLEAEKLYQLLEFNKEGKKSSRPKAAGYYWPTSMGFSMLKNLLTEGESAVKDIISLDGEEDLDDKIIKSILKGIGKAEWAAACLLVVAELLEKLEDVSANRNEWLFILDAMYRLAIYLQQFNERPQLLKRMKRRMNNTLVRIIAASIWYCAQIDPSKFPSFIEGDVGPAKQEHVRDCREDLEKVCDKMAHLDVEDVSEDEWLYCLSSEDESGPSAAKEGPADKEDLRGIREQLEEVCDKMGHSITTGDVEDEWSGLSSEDESGPSAAKGSPIATSGEAMDVDSAPNATREFEGMDSPS